MIALVFNVVLVALPAIGMVVAYFVTGWWLDRADIHPRRRGD